jgi:hypothetical protein
MSSRSFRSVFMVASCAGAALSCYLVSLRVASERAALEDVEAKIVVAQGDMRVLQTEIGTRGRLSQLERWNAGAFALSAPQADQFLKGSFELAQLARPERKLDFQAPVVLASAPAPVPQRPLTQAETDESAPAVAAASPRSLLHEASLKTETREVPTRTVVELPPTATKATGKPATAAKPAKEKPVAKPGLAAAQPAKKEPEKAHAAARETVAKASVRAVPKKVASAPKSASKKSVDKPVIAKAKAVTKPVRIAKVDPLAPLPAKHSGNPKGTATER